MNSTVMWICPKCHQQFVNTGQWHSCGNNTVESFLEGKSPKSVDIYHALIKEFERIGDFELHPAKTRIALNVKMRFASINRLSSEALLGHLVLTENHEDTSCFFRIEVVTPKAVVHHFRLEKPEDITEELKGYMRIAYEVGTRSHFK